MKKILFLIVVIGALGIGYAIGARKTGPVRSETGLRDFGTAASIRTAIGLNRQLDGTQIDVTVEGGRAELVGAVGTPDQRTLAAEIAHSIDGVESVNNRLAVDPSLARVAAPAERSLGQRLDDLTATARIHAALALHRDIKEGDVSVKVLRGEATLTGTVPSWAARELAGKVVEDVEGVLYVTNELRVVGAAGEAPPPADAPIDEADRRLRERVTDGSVRLQIEAALHVNPFIEARRVHVEVRQGHVTLTGHVRTEADRALVQKITEDCWGVTGVTNELVVQPEAPDTLDYAPPPTRRPAFEDE